MSKNNYWVLLLKGENEQIFTPWPECEKNELIKPEEILPMLLRISLRGKAPELRISRRVYNFVSLDFLPGNF